ncbi:MAG: hypothetical protein KC421_21650, partial [Anaerolineales bacterium]|nr:hypothetical protein [Anaerolineales bacterium]
MLEESMEKTATSTALSAGVSATYRLCITPRTATNHPKLLKSAHSAGLTQLTTIAHHRLYFLQGTLTLAEVEKIGHALLTDPVTEKLKIDNLGLTIDPHSQFTIHNSQFIIETTLLPGVTDPPAESLVRAAK